LCVSSGHFKRGIGYTSELEWERSVVVVGGGVVVVDYMRITVGCGLQEGQCSTGIGRPIYRESVDKLGRNLGQTWEKNLRLLCKSGPRFTSTGLNKQCHYYFAVFQSTVRLFTSAADHSYDECLRTTISRVVLENEELKPGASIP